MTTGGPRYTSSAWRWIKDTPGQDHEPPSPRALADRARREAMAEGRDLTGRMLGDPPAGRSALDKLREREARKAAGVVRQDPALGVHEQSSIEDPGGGDAGKRDEA